MTEGGRYQLYTHDFRTPRGHPARFWLRSDTNDWNTAQASTSEDEYSLASLDLTGLAIDIGGYIGTVSVALALDNPELRVICVEPVPENIALIRRNLVVNGVAERVRLVEGMAGHRGKDVVSYAYQGDEVALHHAFVGNAALVAGEVEHTALTVPSYSLADITDEPVSFLKIDCEGGEYAFFAHSDLSRVDLIVGEWHPVDPGGGGHSRDDIVDVLGETHRVTFTGPVEGPGGFRAERR